MVIIRSREDSIRSLIDNKEGHEFTNDPRDPGGATKYGITLGTYSMWVGRPVTPEEVEAMTLDTAIEIYENVFWTANRLDEIHLGLAHFMMDSVVQHGNRPIKWLQKFVGVTQDGKIGPVTLAAINSKDPYDLLHRMATKRDRFYEGLSAYPHFANGWKARLMLTVVEAASAENGE